MARDVVEHLREQLPAFYASEIAMLKPESLEALLAVVEAAKDVQKGRTLNLARVNEWHAFVLLLDNLDAALARLYAGSSGESD